MKLLTRELLSYKLYIVVVERGRWDRFGFNPADGYVLFSTETEDDSHRFQRPHSLTHGTESVLRSRQNFAAIQELPSIL
jgi:hypothetical protein